MHSKFLVLSFVVSLASASQAVTVYSNFGPSNSFNASTGWLIGNASPNVFVIGMNFTANATANVSAITVATNSSMVSGIRLNLYTEVGGLPGTLLESNLSAPNVGGLFTVAGSGSTLISGQNYVLAMSAVDPNEDTGWCYTSPAVNVNGSYTVNNGAWNAFLFEPGSVFKIEGEPVPEPASIMALAAGLIAVARRRRSR